MTASERMAGMVDLLAAGYSRHRPALIAAIAELERDRDAQAERLAAFESCDRARRAAEAEVARLREEVAALKAEVARLLALGGVK